MTFPFMLRVYIAKRHELYQHKNTGMGTDDEAMFVKFRIVDFIALLSRSLSRSLNLLVSNVSNNATDGSDT